MATICAIASVTGISRETGLTRGGLRRLQSLWLKFTDEPSRRRMPSLAAGRSNGEDAGATRPRVERGRADGQTGEAAGAPGPVGPRASGAQPSDETAEPPSRRTTSRPGGEPRRSRLK